MVVLRRSARARMSASWMGASAPTQASSSRRVKLAQVDGLIARRTTAVPLGMPTYRDIAGRTATLPLS